MRPQSRLAGSQYCSAIIQHLILVMTLVAESTGHEMPKGYLYCTMALPSAVKMLNSNFLTTTESQFHLPGGIGVIHFTGVCGPDGHSQAPMGGFMASCGMDGPNPGLMAEYQG